MPFDGENDTDSPFVDASDTSHERKSGPPSWGWGLLLPALDYRRRAYGRCYSCRRPWWAATKRNVQYRPGQCQFALCVRCWKRCFVDARLRAHQWVTGQVGPELLAAAVEAAVLAADDSDGFLSWPELEWLESLADAAPELRTRIVS